MFFVPFRNYKSTHTKRYRTVKITFNQIPTTAVAGNDQVFIDGTLTATLAANTPGTGHGIGKWVIISGSGGSFSNEDNPNTIFTGQIHNEYILRWTISTPCHSSFDELTLLFEKDVVVDIEGYIYKTVSIGTQNWMAENLKTTKYNNGSSIFYPGADKAAWASNRSGAYAWYNNVEATNKSIYGALYNWHAVNSGKICPSGWHVPSDAEFTELENFMIANGYNYDGTTSENKIAKALASKDLWDFSAEIGDVGNNPGSNNRSGFSGLPGGVGRIDGSFYGVGSNGGWWSATESTASNKRPVNTDLFVAGTKQISNFLDHYYLLVNLHDSIKEYGLFLGSNKFLKKREIDII